MQLQGATAIVIGGAVRLGRDITLALARAGANVAIAYNRSKEAAEETAQEALESGVNAITVHADAADSRQVDDLLSKLSDSFPRIDILVGNAGTFRRTPLESVTDAEWTDLMRNNLDVFRVPAVRIGRMMKAQGSGCIIAIADVAGLRPWVDYAPYSTAKAAVITLARALAREFAPEVRVNAIAPGPILFPSDGDGAAFRREIARTLLKRHGHPTDITEAVLFLARADFITGVVLPVDGGRELAK